MKNNLLITKQSKFNPLNKFLDMSQKLLKSLDLPSNLIEKLNAASLHTVNDIISKTPMDLVKLLNIPLSRVEALLANTYKSASTIPQVIDALTLFKNHQDTQIDLDDLDSFDCILNEHELLKTGILTEICGPPGVRKTSFNFY